MEKFLRFVGLVFFSGIAIIFTIILFFENTLFEKSETLPYEKIAKFYSKNSSYDMVILGSSRAEGNFIPKLLESNNSAYNYGLPGTGNKIWYYMLLDEIDNSTPKTIIINIDLEEYPIIIGEDYNYNYYLKLPEDTYLYKSINRSTKSNILPYPFYYFGTIKGFISESLKDYINLTTKTDNGFKGNTNAISDEQFKLISNMNKSVNVRFDEKLWLNLFERISSSNDKVYFVVAPIYHTILKDINYSKFKTDILNLSENYSKIEFYDFSNSINKRDLFYDPNHLNYEGAIKFSGMLKDSLTR